MFPVCKFHIFGVLGFWGLVVKQNLSAYLICKCLSLSSLSCDCKIVIIAQYMSGFYVY